MKDIVILFCIAWCVHDVYGTALDEVSVLCDIYNINAPYDWPEPGPCNWTTPCQYFLKGVNCSGESVVILCLPII